MTNIMIIPSNHVFEWNSYFFLFYLFIFFFQDNDPSLLKVFWYAWNFVGVFVWIVHACENKLGTNINIKQIGIIFSPTPKHVTTLSAELRICQMYSLQVVKACRTKGVSWAWHKTASDGEAPVLEFWWVWSTFISVTPRFTLIVC